MLFVILLALSGLTLSAVAIYYSVLGLTAIFAAAFWPIVVMGTTLEVSKLVAASWLKAYWPKIPLYMKSYMMLAVIVLMLITSMGIFGFLSKAHSDQTLVSGDVQSNLAVYDEKIKTARENIDAARKQLKQMDEAVDQVMARSTTETGATRANDIRRAQQRDRVALAKDIESNQKLIASLNDQAAPIRAEVRKVEAEVGPIKYIAAFVYGDNPDANILEKAVTWVIITIIFVFDPLAVLLLLGSQMTYQWYRTNKENSNILQETPVTADQLVVEENTVVPDEIVEQSVAEVDVPLEDYGQCPNCGTDLLLAPGIGIFCPNKECETVETLSTQTAFDQGQQFAAETLLEKTAKRIWKQKNPNATIKAQETALKEHKLADLPWHDPSIIDQAHTAIEEVDFGTAFPADPVRHTLFVRVDSIPTKLYRYNGQKWIEIDKNNTDTFTYNDRYIDHLIAKISTGEYDADLLNAAEQHQVESRLNES